MGSLTPRHPPCRSRSRRARRPQDPWLPSTSLHPHPDGTHPPRRLWGGEPWPPAPSSPCVLKPKATLGPVQFLLRVPSQCCTEASVPTYFCQMDIFKYTYWRRRSWSPNLVADQAERTLQCTWGGLGGGGVLCSLHSFPTCKKSPDFWRSQTLLSVALWNPGENCRMARTDSMRGLIAPAVRFRAPNSEALGTKLPFNTPRFLCNSVSPMSHA